MNRSPNKSPQSRSINKKQNQSFVYNILKDPHLLYYLQSPARVTQLLESGLYQLVGNKLVELETLESLKISEFVMEKISPDIISKYSRNQKNQLNESKVNKNNSSSLFKDAESSWDPSTSVLFQKKSKEQNFSQSIKKQNWKAIYGSKGTKKKTGNHRAQLERSLKGLKNFQKKIL